MERTFLNFNTFLPPNQATKLLRTRFPCSPDPEEFCVCVNSDPRFQEAGTPSAGPLVPQLLAPLILPRSQGADGPTHLLPSTPSHRQAMTGQARPGQQHFRCTSASRPRPLGTEHDKLWAAGHSDSWPHVLGESWSKRWWWVSTQHRCPVWAFSRGPVWHLAGPLEDAHHSPSSGKDLPAITATKQEEHSGRNAREVKAAVPPAPPHLCPVHLNPKITQSQVKATSVFPNNNNPPSDECKARQASTTMPGVFMLNQ